MASHQYVHFVAIVELVLYCGKNILDNINVSTETKISNIVNFSKSNPPGVFASRKRNSDVRVDDDDDDGLMSSLLLTGGVEFSFICFVDRLSLLGTSPTSGVVSVAIIRIDNGTVEGIKGWI